MKDSVLIWMLGTFPQAFSLGYFPKWQLPKCTISQAATSQMYIFPNDNFPNGNFPMKENRQLPKCIFSQETIS